MQEGERHERELPTIRPRGRGFHDRAGGGRMRHPPAIGADAAQRHRDVCRRRRCHAVRVRPLLQRGAEEPALRRHRHGAEAGHDRPVDDASARGVRHGFGRHRVGHVHRGENHDRRHRRRPGREARPDRSTGRKGGRQAHRPHHDVRDLGRLAGRVLGAREEPQRRREHRRPVPDARTRCDSRRRRGLLPSQARRQARRWQGHHRRLPHQGLHRRPQPDRPASCGLGTIARPFLRRIAGPHDRPRREQRAHARRDDRSCAARAREQSAGILPVRGEREHRHARAQERCCRIDARNSGRSTTPSRSPSSSSGARPTRW